MSRPKTLHEIIDSKIEDLIEELIEVQFKLEDERPLDEVMDELELQSGTIAGILDHYKDETKTSDTATDAQLSDAQHEPRCGTCKRDQ